jgi:mannosidase alpha-like ER degradation enhancer 1
MHRGEDLFCPAYEPPTLGGLVVGIERRVDYEYARSLVFGWGVDGRVIEDKESVHWWEGGFCSLPSAPTFVSRQTLVTSQPSTNFWRRELREFSPSTSS